MSYKIICTQNFLNDAKRLQKKFPNIKTDFLALKNVLKHDLITGNRYTEDGCYKVRMAISDQPKGQSGGARVIIKVEVIERIVYVVAVYAKNETEVMKPNAPTKLLKALGLKNENS